MRALLLTFLFVLCVPAHAFQCGPFTIEPDRNRTTINGDVVHIVGAQFYGAPRDYSRATIMLLPDSITTTDRQYRMETEGGNATLELLTREKPPRVLNREQCDDNLSGFSWYSEFNR